MRCGENASCNYTGDREHLGRLTVAVQQRLGPFIFRAIRDPHAAEDILQETLLAMVERLDSLRRAECFWPWIFRVARRKIQDHIRQHPRWTQGQDDTPPWIERRVDDDATDVLDRIIRAEDTHQLSHEIGRMDRRQRRIIHLRCFEQLPYAQIARQTRTSPGQARICFHRAKTWLRDRLQALSA